MDVTWKDFFIFGSWIVDQEGIKYDSGEPAHLIDQTTGRKYWNESRSTVWCKCVLLTLGTPFVHPIAGVANIAYRIFRLVSLSHFSSEESKTRSLKQRCVEAGKDVLRIGLTPFAVVALELAALYGALIRPYDGRKLYASLERALYGDFVLAPCFQPNPTRHLAGGDPNKKGSF
jgi:hypothetical protein